MDNHLDYFDNCPVGTVYETTIDYGPGLVGETSIWKFLYASGLDASGKLLGTFTYKYERVE